MNLRDMAYLLLDGLGESFLRLFNLSIAAGVLILAAALIRRLFPRMPKWLRCLLWALPALRLLLPFSLPNPFSLAPNTDTVYQVRTAADSVSVPVINSGLEAVDNAVNPVLERSFTGLAQSAASVTERAKELTPASFFGLIWAAGCAALLLYMLFSFLRFRKTVRPAVPLEKGVYLCDGIASPFILGVIHPKIYLPSLLEERHYPPILAHEQAHLKRKDHWWKPLGFLLLTVYWFNPLIWIAYALLCRDIELACDEKVIKNGDISQRKAYSEALLTCGAPTRSVAACPLAFGEVGVKSRIKNVLRYKKPAVWIIVAAVLAAGAAAFCFLTDRPAAWENQWGSVYVSDRVYLDPVLSPGKAGKQTPFRLILDDENHMLIRRTREDGEGGVYVRDLGLADIGGEYLGGTDLWSIAREYAPAQYRHSEPQKSPGAATRENGLNGVAYYHVLFRPRGNAFFYASFKHVPRREPELQSLCRMKRVGRFTKEPLAARWYVTVPVRDVRYLNVSGAFGNHFTYCGHENPESGAMTFDVGENVFLNGLDGIEDISKLEVTAYRSDHTVAYSFTVPEGTDAYYTDEQGWQFVRCDNPVPDGGASDFAVITAFLRTWFTPDIKERYTRLHQNWPSGSQAADEQAIADYFSGIRDYVTDEFYQKTVMNRGYHSYDQFVAERGLSVAVRGVRIETTDDGNFTFTVHLEEGNCGIDDSASGQLRMKGGKIDGMHVSAMTLGQDRPESGETPTAAYEETAASPDNAEWTTAAPPEEYSEPAGKSLYETTSPYERAGTAAEISPVHRALIDYLHITPDLLELAERDVEQIGQTVTSDGITLTVEQALTYPDVCGIVVTVSFPEKTLQGRRADELYPIFLLTNHDCDTGFGDAGDCEIISQGKTAAVYLIRLYCRQPSAFAANTEVGLSFLDFSTDKWEKGDFVVTPKKPLRVLFMLTHVGKTKPIVFTASSQSRKELTGVAALSPLSLTVTLTGPTKAYRDASGDDDLTAWTEDVRLTLDHGIPAARCAYVGGREPPLSRQFALSAFVDPDAVRYLFIGEQRINCQTG